MGPSHKVKTWESGKGSSQRWGTGQEKARGGFWGRETSWFLTWVWGSVYWIYFTLWIYIKLCAYNTCPFVIFNEVKEILGRTTEHYLNSIVKSRDITLSTKVRLVKAMVFPVVMYKCECWTIRRAEHRITDAFELWCWRSPLDGKEIQPFHPKEDQSWVFTGRTDVEAETPILWLPDPKS